MPDIFLSYSREDQPIARRFAEGFEREGFSVWWDQTLNAGEDFDRVTEKALEEAKAVVVLWSRHSVDSRWVRAEATQAHANHRLVPATIEPCKRPIMFELTHTADLSGWKGDPADGRWRSFVDGLKRQFGVDGSANAPTPSKLPAPSTSRVWMGWAVAAAAVLAAVAAGLFWHLHGSKAPSTSTAGGASIAVLPLKDFSQAQDQGYFVDGITEEILNSLARIPELKVTARTSSFAYKNKDVNLHEVGQTLGVANVLEGSLRKEGDQLKITLQLIDTRTDAHRWSKTYDRPFKDVFVIQEDIARSVAEALQISLGVGDLARDPGMTRNVEAYDAYLEATSLIERFDVGAQRRSIALYEQAIALDPKFANAVWGLMGAYGGMIALAGGDGQEWRNKADETMKRARETFPDYPYWDFLMGQRSMFAGHWKEAGAYFRASAERYKKLTGTAPQGGGTFLLLVGRGREALEALEEDKARDPLNGDTAFWLGFANTYQGDFRSAFAELDRYQKIVGPDDLPLGGAALAIAMSAQDRRQIELWLRAPANAGATRTDALGAQFTGRIRQLLDDRPAALELVRASVNDPQTNGVGLAGLSIWLAYFGEPKEALEIMRTAAQRGANGIVAPDLWLPLMRDVRALPEFKQFARDFGLVDYWKEYGWGDFCKPVGTDDFQCH